MITSPSNPKLRYARHLARSAFRAREGRLLLEGVRLIEDALEAGAVPAFALVDGSPEAQVRSTPLRAQLEAHGVPVFDVDPSLWSDLAQTEASQGVLAVVPVPALPIPADLGLVLIVDGLRDPGNLGTLLRTAAAAGVDLVLLGPGTVDATNPKVLRAAMGAHFRVAMQASDWGGIAAIVRAPPQPLAVWMAEAGGAVDYTSVDWTAPTALVIGGEARGPSSESRALAGGVLRIPMAGGVESLNAATAAAVILFEARRQRAGEAQA
jgi:TrmH family RNA methyltransferase